jgi:hypothetical protein
MIRGGASQIGVNLMMSEQPSLQAKGQFYFQPLFAAPAYIGFSFGKRRSQKRTNCRFL